MTRLIPLVLTLLIACGQSTSETPAKPDAAAAQQPAPAAQATPEAAPAAATKASAEGATQSTPAADAPDKTVLFFLNPNGRPCQAQDAIIKEMGTKLTDKAQLVYVSVADPSARQVLMKYGVRALPTLIVVDAQGAELHRFSPGIQQPDAILGALD